MSNLSTSMRAARDTIAQGGVTYRYRPLRKSTRRPLPVKQSDLTPRYSHGLHAASVEALIRRGVVRLHPLSPDHGTVALAPTD